MQVRVDKIELWRQKLRFELKEEETRALAEDMERQGQIQPIAVKHIEGDRYELVAGRRRWEAAKMLGWEFIEAFEGEYKQGIDIAASAENIKRLQMSPMEEAAHVAYLHTEGNMSIGAIAEATGHGTSWVQDRLAIGALPLNLQEGLHKGWFKIGAAMILGKITDAAQLDYYIHCARVGGCTASTAEAWWLDWSARNKANPNLTYEGEIPHTLPLPEPPPCKCFLCRELKPRVDAVVVTICIECCQTVDAEVKKALYGVPPAPELQNLAPPETGGQTDEERAEDA